jgi:hypothetical protein
MTYDIFKKKSKNNINKQINEIAFFLNKEILIKYKQFE